MHKRMNSINEPEFIPTKSSKNGGYLVIDCSSWLFRLIFLLRNKYKYLSKVTLTNLKKKPKRMKNLIFQKGMSWHDFVIENIKSCMKDHIIMYHTKYHTNKTVVCRDGNDYWRKKLYENYKAQRKSYTRHKGEDLILSNIFSDIYTNIYPSFIEEMGALHLKVDGAEADDIIAIITRDIIDTRQSRVVIIADDYDYFQLMELPSVEVYNLSGEHFRKLKPNVTPRNYLRSKIMKGDKSDNIPPCKIIVDKWGFLATKSLTLWEAENLIRQGALEIQRIPAEIAQQLSCKPKKIKQLAKKDPIFNKYYLRNAHLIDMTYIPNSIEDAIIYEFYEAHRIYKGVAARVA